VTSRRATTIVEAVIFGAIASLVVVGIIGLVTRGSKLVDFSRRTSATSSDLKNVLEKLSEDAAELVYLDNSGKAYDSSQGGTKLSFVVRSTRSESLPAPPSGATGLRRIEYRLDGSDKLKDCIRTVTQLGPNNQAAGSTEEKLAVKGVSSFKVWPIAAVPQAGGKYVLSLADAQPAGLGGATVACLLVEVSAGEASSDSALESQTVTKLATKLWCRNRVIELSRGALR